MSYAIRKQRTLDATQQTMTVNERALLSELSASPYYPALLDLMERSCIVLDTALIDTPASDPEAVLGAHAISAGAWKFFTYMQTVIQNAHRQHTDVEVEPEQRSETDQILNP